jgi:hypothetical protein
MSCCCPSLHKQELDLYQKLQDFGGEALLQAWNNLAIRLKCASCGSIPPIHKELAILRLLYHRNCPHLQFHHEERARQLGVHVTDSLANWRADPQWTRAQCKVLAFTDAYLIHGVTSANANANANANASANVLDKTEFELYFILLFYDMACQVVKMCDHSDKKEKREQNIKSAL